jgi:hypothetical protein
MDQVAADQVAAGRVAAGRVAAGRVGVKEQVLRGPGGLGAAARRLPIPRRRLP